jgi:hypothetical protein
MEAGIGGRLNHSEWALMNKMTRFTTAEAKTIFYAVETFLRHEFAIQAKEIGYWVDNRSRSNQNIIFGLWIFIRIGVVSGQGARAVRVCF